MILVMRGPTRIASMLKEAKMKNDSLQMLLSTDTGHMEKPNYWAGDRILRDGVLGQCANPIPNYRFNPPPAICAAAQQAKDAVVRQGE